MPNQEEILKGYQRYEAIRKFNLNEFDELYKRCLKNSLIFDKELDKIIEEKQIAPLIEELRGHFNKYLTTTSYKFSNVNYFIFDDSARKLYVSLCNGKEYNYSYKRLLNSTKSGNEFRLLDSDGTVESTFYFYMPALIFVSEDKV